MWWAFWCRWNLWSGHTRRLVCEQSLTPSAHRASCNWALWSLTFQLTTRFSKQVKYGSYFRAVSPQLWKVSSSPNKAGQLSIVPHPQSQELSSVFCSIPTLGGWLQVLPYPHSRRSALHFSPLLPGRGELCSLSMMFSFGEGGAICSPATLDYVVPSRVGNLLHSPVGVADSLWWTCVQPERWRKAVSGWYGSSTLQNLVQFFLQSFAFSKTMKEKKRGGGNSWQLSLRQARDCTSPSPHRFFPSCYVH
jgi:hypothetical protein